MSSPTIQEFKDFIPFIEKMKELPLGNWEQPIASGKWTLKELVCHLWHWDRLTLEQMLPLMEAGAKLPAFPNIDKHNEAAKKLAQDFGSGAELVEAFVATRQELLNMLMEKYDQKARFTIGSGKRQYSFDSYVGIFTHHDAHHRKQIEALLPEADGAGDGLVRYPFGLDAAQIERIRSHFGSDFYEEVLERLPLCAERWQLTEISLLPSYSANLVFSCRSLLFGDAVLKLGKETDGIGNEYRALLHLNRERVCTVFDADPDNRMLLEERIQPGIPLRAEPSLERRLDVFCRLYSDLHQHAPSAEAFPTYTGWVHRITEEMGARPDCVDFYFHMKRACDMYDALLPLYGKQTLLHGDFHHDNILQRQNGEYAIIDPKGVIGDPVFDVPRFMLNEYRDELTLEELRENFNFMFGYLEKKLGIPVPVLRQCLYIETAMGVCWGVEDGASLAEREKLLRTVGFAESLLHKQK